jgi:DNA repair protein RadA
MAVKKKERTNLESFIKQRKSKYNLPNTALNALKNFGIFDARVLSVLTESEIASIPQISEKTAQNLVNAADDAFRGPLFQKAIDQSERLLQKRKYFTTGSEAFDELLGGGMPTSAIIEINGEYRTGKTQTCLTCSVTAQLPEEYGGLDRPVIYIDTENSFQATHLQEIGTRFGFGPEELLDRLFVVKAEQLRYLDQAIERLPGYVQALDPGLIIIDSLMAPFRTEFHELNLLAVRQKKIGKLIGLLKRIAIAFNNTVIFTNQVLANIGFGAQYKPVVATGGHVVAHASDIRIFMKKLKKNKRRAQIDDCAWLPADRTEFYITPSGIADSKELSEDDYLDWKEPSKKEKKEDKETEEKKDNKKESKKSQKKKADKESEPQDESSDEEVSSPLLEGISEVEETQKPKKTKKAKEAADKEKAKSKEQKKEDNSSKKSKKTKSQKENEKEDKEENKSKKPTKKE